MKGIVSFVLALCVIALAVPSYADTMMRIKGDVKTVMMSPLKVSDNVKKETTNAKFLPFALAGGFLKGSFYMAKDIVTGSLDIVTSPLDMIKR